MSNLAELVVKCARRLGDAVMVEATGNGLVTTFIDALHIDADRRHWVGSQIFFHNSAQDNFGLDRFVTAAAGSTLTWTTAVASATAIGDEAVIINARGKGWELDEYKHAINDGIGRIRGVVMQQLEHQDCSAGFAVGTPTVTVPTALNEIYAVDWYSARNGMWVTVPKAHGRNGDGWSVEGSGVIRVNGPSLYDGNGADARVSGYAYQPELDAWDDELIVAETPVLEYAVLALTKLAIDRENRNPILYTPNEKDAATAMSRYRTVRRRGATVIRP